MSSTAGSAVADANRVLVGDRGLPAQSVRERVLEFMQSHPTAWRAKPLAAKLRIKVELLRAELLRLQREGMLVSCTVSAPNRQPQEEYRIAAHARVVDLYKFTIGKKETSRRSRPTGAGRTRPKRP